MGPELNEKIVYTHTRLILALDRLFIIEDWVRVRDELEAAGSLC